MLVFLLLCFFVDINSINIAYVGKNTDPIYQSFLQEYDRIHEDVEIKLVNDGISTDYSVEFNDVVEAGIQMVVMKCNDAVYNSNVDAIANKKITIFCTNTYNVGRCSSNVISGVSVIPLIENGMYYIINF